MKNVIFGIVSFVAITAGLCMAFPQPSAVPDDMDWTLTVEFDQLNQITVQLPGQSEPQRFWYIILTLTNNTDFEEVPFYPTCDLMTDSFDIIPSGAETRRIIFEKIKLKHQGRYPFLQELDSIDHKVLKGTDNTIDIAIIWPDFAPNTKEVNLFIGGLSSETTAVKHPTAKDDMGNQKELYLRKSLWLKYSVGGDETLRQSIKPGLLSQEWIMR